MIHHRQCTQGKGGPLVLLNTKNVRTTSKFAQIQPIIQQQTVQVEIEPRPTWCMTGQVFTSTHQRLIDLAIDFLQDNEYIGMPDLESDYEDPSQCKCHPEI